MTEQYKPRRDKNLVLMTGRLGKDPESRYTPTGKQVVSFSLAVTDVWGKGDEQKSHTNWVPVETWNGTAEAVSKYLHKGDKVLIEGSLRVEQFEQDGQRRYYTKLVATDVQFLSPRQVDEPADPVEELPF